MKKLTLTLSVSLMLAILSLASQQSPTDSKPKSQNPRADNSMHEAHSRMGQRGEEGMGFSQTATTHHFLLKPDGGVIQVEAIDPCDTTNRDNIRMHLTHIAQNFAGSDFNIPMFVHDTVPPGVPAMKGLRNKIRYSFDPTPQGGRVVISTADKEALAAIHKFLVFQIQEHKTGDSTGLR